jgi:glycosyltransferase involved in cell wall biosynthesis
MNKSLGLSMIVKNESHVILRALSSISPIIDHWVIVDTGSTDGTQDIIKNFFKEKGIPGELIEIEWKDFSTSRNVALNAIEPHADFGIWLDADEELIIEPSFDKQKMLSKVDKDGNIFHSISIRTVYGKVDYTRKNIWKTNMKFYWNGPIHELLSSPLETTGDLGSGLHVIVRPEGSSWGNIKEKYLSHAKILEEYCSTTNDPRWVFYTAQSYRDASEWDKSIEWYTKRAQMKEGFYEEIFISRFMIAKLSEAAGKSKNECSILYQEAHGSDPNNLRGEAIKSLIQMYHRHQDWENSYVFSLYGLRYNRANPYPNRILFLDKGLYDYEMLELHALACFYTNRKEEGSRVYWMLRQQLEQLGAGYLSDEMMKRVMENEKYFPVTQAMMQKAPQVSKRPVFPSHGGTKKNRKK